MKTNRAGRRSRVVTATRYISRTLWSIAVMLLLLAGVPAAQAQTHTVIPGATVNASGGLKEVVVDSTRHYIFTVNSSAQVQVTFISNGAWATAPLGTGQPVKVTTNMYLNSSSHVLFYVGTDNHIWCWFVNGSAWANARVNGTEDVARLVGVDSANIVWYQSGSSLNSLRALYFNGSAWVVLTSKVTDYSEPGCGGVVDQASHSLIWSNSDTNVLRGLLNNARAFVPAELYNSISTNMRPAIMQGTGEIYFTIGTRQLARFLISGNYTYDLQTVSDPTDPVVDTLGAHSATFAVHPTSGKIWFNRNVNGVIDVCILTRSIGSGQTQTWSKVGVPNTSGQVICDCDLDTINNWFFYTNTVASDQSLHIIY